MPARTYLESHSHGARANTDNAEDRDSTIILPGEQETVSSINEEDQEITEEMTSLLPEEQEPEGTSVDRHQEKVELASHLSKERLV